jgi:hypothetical protein
MNARSIITAINEYLRTLPRRLRRPARERAILRQAKKEGW